MFMRNIRSGKLITLLPNLPTAQREYFTENKLKVQRGNVATNSGKRRNVTLKRRRRRAEITAPPIVCQKESKGCVFYNGAEGSSGLRVQEVFLWGVGACKVNTQFYKEMKA
jgi:hypothetical protein